MKRLLYFFMLLMLLSSCNEKNGGNVFTVSVGGNPYDLMVVGNKSDWNGPAGRAIFDFLNQDTPGLPQSEPMFKIIFLEPHNFTNIVHPMRNILFYQIDSNQFTQGKVTYIKDKWADTQAIIKITAPNHDEVIRVLKEKGQAIIDFFVEMESERNILYFKRYCNNDGMLKMHKELGIKLTIPNYINKSKVGDNFIWMSNGSIDTRMDILAYRTPYKDSTDFNLDRIIERRDSITKIYVEGPSEGSYMTTENEVIPPTARTIYYKKKRCVEVRGLWRTEGDFMGGPFVSRTFLDKKKNELITVETFVYAPQHKKRNKIRHVEAILHTLDFD